MTHCLNTLANLIQQYIWLAPVLALLGGLVTSFTPCSLSSVPPVSDHGGRSCTDIFDLWFTGICAGTLSS